jgi:thiol-disulfide isomerase/thioredoxin
MKTNFVFLLLLAAAAFVSCTKRPAPDLAPPSEISSRITDSVMVHVWNGDVAGQEDFNGYRNQFARTLVDSMQTEVLDREETVTCAQILHWSGRSSAAEKLLEPLAAGDDEIARDASTELVMIKSESGRLEEAERLMSTHRKKFPPNPAAGTDLWLCVDDVVTRYNDSGRPGDAARAIMDELDSLPFDYAYRSFFLVEDLVPLMTELDRLPDLRERVARYRAALEESLEKHLSTPAPTDSTRERFDEITKGYQGYVKFFGDVLGRIDMIGRNAPSLTFRHVYNADSTRTFESMRGKVTVMDFWATWCVACVIGYGEMGHLYSDYKDRGLAVVGVTSLQGQYRDGTAARDEGSEDNPLTVAREIELTGEYIAKNRMIWPCGVSDIPLEKTGFKVKGLPTYVILDGEGVIRYMQIGIGKEKQMRRVIEKLVNEGA